MKTPLDIDPRLTRLPDGCVLAVNPSRRPSVGVVAADEESARVAFQAALERRVRLIAAAKAEDS